MKPIAILVLLSINLLGYSQKEITINNVKSRMDINGKIIDTHGGRVVRIDKKYYWYCESYGNTNGFTTGNFYSCYSSDDLTIWKFEGKLLADAPSGVYYRPHVIYNKNTKKYILWYNWNPVLWEGKTGVAVSDKPTGPFKIINPDVKLKHFTLKVGDYNLFVDDDNSAYIVYNTIDGHKISVEKLSSDYLSSALDNSGFLASNCEASAMFKRKGIYYLLTDYCCCFCGEGAGARVYIADKPMGPYRLTNNINRYPGKPVFNLFNGINDKYDKLSLSKGEMVDIVAPEKITCNQVKIVVGWENYRTHCSASSDDTIRFEDNIVPAFALQYKKNNEWVTVETNLSIRNEVVRLECQMSFPDITATEFRIKTDKAVYFPVNLCEIEFFNTDKPVSSNQFKVYKTNGGDGDIIIPAQQTFVMELATPDGPQYIWAGDLWGSRPDNIKGHDFQFWSKPLEFLPDGTIKPLEWVDEWKIKILK